MKMCQALASHGNEVTLHAFKGEGERSQAYKHYGVSQSFDIQLHNTFDSKTIPILNNFKSFLPDIPIGGLPTVIYGASHLRTNNLLRQTDLIYARNLNWLFGQSASTPFILESHRPPDRLVHRTMERQLFSRPGFLKLVVISDRLKERYVKIFPSIRNKIFVAHDGGDDPFKTDVQSQIEPSFEGLGQNINVGYVGHLYAGRGTGIIKALAEAHPKCRFHCIGGRQADIATFQNSGLPENIILHGHHPHSRLAAFYPKLDIVLAPYQKTVAVSGNSGNTADFMSPLKLFEYMSWQKAIICSDLPVLREVLNDGETALLVSPDQKYAWISALDRLIKNPDQRAMIAKNAREKFLARHTWHQRAGEIMAAAGV